MKQPNGFLALLLMPEPDEQPSLEERWGDAVPWCCRAALDESHINAAHAVEKHARRALRQTLMKAASEHSSERCCLSSACLSHTNAMLLSDSAEAMCTACVSATAILHHNSSHTVVCLHMT